MALTDKQQVFVAEYVRSLNATRAAVKAGYSPRSAAQIGHELLEKTLVADAIARAMADRLATIGVDPSAILEEVTAIAFAKLGDFAEWGPERFELKESGEVDTRAVQGVTIKEITITNDHGEIRKVEQGIKTHDKLAALKLLGTRAGIFVDRKEITGKDGGPLMVTDPMVKLNDDDVDRRIAELESQLLGPSDLGTTGVPGSSGGTGEVPGGTGSTGT